MFLRFLPVKCVFAVLAEKCIFTVLTRNRVFTVFPSKTRFLRFGMKIQFLILAKNHVLWKNAFLWFWRENEIFVFFGFGRKTRFGR